MVLSAGQVEMTNASLYVGSNSSSVQANTLVAVSPSGEQGRPPVASRSMLRAAGAAPRARHTPNQPPSLPSACILQTGLDIPPRQQVAVPVGGVKGRYIIVWTGALTEVGADLQGSLPGERWGPPAG